MATAATTSEPVHRIRLYTPHPGQLPVHRSPARFRVANAGRRFGKTYCALNELGKFAWEHPGSTTWWVAPTYRQAKRAYRLFVKHFRAAFAGKPSETELRIPWSNGSTTEFLSAENWDALKGDGVHFVVIDEAAQVKAEAWHEAIRPTLSDTHGRALIISTPRAKNWFYDEWSRGQDRQAWPDYESFVWPTSANPFIPPAEVEAARKTLPPDVFRQEYLAEFLEDSSTVFRSLAACESGDLEDYVVGRGYVIGWDVAKTMDASVFTVLDVTTQHVVAWERHLGVDYIPQVGIVGALSRRYGGAPILMDSTGVGDPVLEMAERAGLPVAGYQFTATSKRDLVEHLAVRIAERAVSWPSALAILHHELARYEYEMTRAGNLRYGAPAGLHDDAVMSLALAVWAARPGAGVVAGTKRPDAPPPVRFPRALVR